MKYRVYFEQVNQQMYEISALTEEKAIDKARIYWEQDWGEAQMSPVVEEADDDRS